MCTNHIQIFSIHRTGQLVAERSFLKKMTPKNISIFKKCFAFARERKRGREDDL